MSERNDIPAWTVDLIAGWCSGAAAIVACQPLDTMLTRWQAAPANSVFRNITTSLVSNSGFKALWRGAYPMITAVPLQNALLMSGYGAGQRFYAGDSLDELAYSKKLAAIFVGGCTGGVLQSFLMSPVELIKVAQQCAGGVSSATMTTAPSSATVTVSMTRVAQNIGMLPALRCGLTATLLRDGIPHGVWFMSYEMCKDVLLSGKELSENFMPISVPLMSGAVAATVAWGVGYPADLIKTRIQASAAAEAAILNPTTGITDTARQLIQEANGSVFSGLYRGFGLKLVRSIPASMIGFTVYEGVKEQLLRI